MKENDGHTAMKERPAARAVELVRDGMVVGLGSGTTSRIAIKKLGERVAAGLSIKAVASSLQSEALARSLSIDVIDPNTDLHIDLAIDGADEIDPDGNLIKGGGGSLLREKIVAFASRVFVIMADKTKLVDRLGRFALPVEITAFGAAITLRHLKDLQCDVFIRQAEGKDFVTDNGNLIADCRFGSIADPAALDTRLKMIPGVVETGLFLNPVVSLILVGREHDVLEMRPRHLRS